jgi:hypothetical protein
MPRKKKVAPPLDRVSITCPVIGLCFMQACAVADATDEEILEVCNRENPSGTTGGWSCIIKRGKGKPVKCADYPDRMHYLIEC